MSKMGLLALYNSSLQNCSGYSPEKVFKGKVDSWLQAAWLIVGEEKKVLGLYPFLKSYTDKAGNPLGVSPLSPEEESKFGVTRTQNVCLAIIEICFYLYRYTDNKDNPLPFANLLCLTADCADLHQRLISMAPQFQVLDKEGYNTEQELRDYKKTRTDPMKNEIASIIEETKGAGRAVTNAGVWVELKKRCNSEWSCCIHVEEAEKGQIIAWQGAGGNIGRLTPHAFNKRMTTYRKEMA
jgi:hypothetical protein